MRSVQAVRHIRSGDTLSYSNSKQLLGVLSLLLVQGLVVGFGWMIFYWMQNISHRPLSRIIIVGDRRFTNNADIQQAILAVGHLKNFMNQNVQDIQKQIENFPWIKQVSVRKNWPDEIKIHLVEYAPIAHWNKVNMLDSEGKIFKSLNDRIDGRLLPDLHGPVGEEFTVLKEYNDINKILIQNKLNLKSLTMGMGHTWRLILSNDICIELGHDIKQRLLRFIKIYPVLRKQGELNEKKINYVDMRYIDGAAVSWSSIPNIKIHRTTSSMD